jgi:hypothetical protein
LGYFFGVEKSPILEIKCLHSHVLGESNISID